MAAIWLPFAVDGSRGIDTKRKTFSKIMSITEFYFYIRRIMRNDADWILSKNS